MNLRHIEKPFILSIFGASGDLAKLKLFPALYSLMEQKRLPQNFYIVGFARTPKNQAEFKKEFSDAITKKNDHPVNKNILNQLTDKVYYFEGQYNEPASYQEYRKYLRQITQGAAISHLAYCSVPPSAFKAIIQNLGETKTAPAEDLRIILEKPFGQDLASATDLFHFLARYFDEDHIYLLDHYLGKSAVQSILYLRQSNRILNQMLKSPGIANIQITALEETGISNRVGYFDQVGTIKDMIQSHLLQILALITMSIPVRETASSFHREKNSILSALSFPDDPENIIIGQYKGYKKEKDAPKSSRTETFAALKLFIDRQSWYKVPIYIRTGKKLGGKSTYVTVEFKKFPFQSKQEEPNLLIIELHPKERLTIRLLNRNGFGQENYKSITTSDSIACTGDDCLPEHGLLLLDALEGRKMHFLSFPEIIASWTVTESILASIQKNKTPLEIYADNSAGPASQNKLTATDHFQWHNLHS